MSVVNPISGFAAVYRPLGSAHSLAAINSSSAGASARPRPVSPVENTAPVDRFESGFYDALVRSGVYAPPSVIRSEGAASAGRGIGDGATTGSNGTEEAKESGDGTAASGGELSEEEEARVEELKARDREVRQHEQAHMAVGGAYAGAASYTYERGPDGQNYAVGGEVSIDVSPESDPEATIAKMRVVRAAALAPANPSGQDMSVAAQAQKQEIEAQQELSRQRMEESQGGEDGVERTGEAASGLADDAAATQDANQASASGAASVQPEQGARANPVDAAHMNASSAVPTRRRARAIDLVA
ncbi:MAG: hypothetical protein LBJ46_11690 [Planctomycetota bacterium]|jgi:hypothetical protein|nr:hypothetical protein [Planctomycetota bacterium]